MSVMFLPRQQVISALLDAGADIDSTDRSGMTPLMAAALGGSLIAVDALISRNAALDVEDLKGRGVLVCAAEGGNDGIVKRIYQKCGRDLVRLARQDQLFANAASGGNRQLVELLLAEGVNVDIRDEIGATPLLNAGGVHPDLARFLIGKGADKSAKSKSGTSLFGMLCFAGD